MKTLLPLATFLSVLLLSTSGFSQGRGIGRAGMDARTRVRMNPNNTAIERVKTRGNIKREEARVNGVLKANEHANARAKEMANENSVLSPASSGTPHLPQGRKTKEKKEKKKD